MNQTSQENTLSIILITSATNKDYISFKKYTEDNQALFKDLKIGIFEQLADTNKGYICYIYDRSMQLVDTLNNFNQQYIEDLIKKIKETGSKLQTKVHTGGSYDYKEKYMKYRLKYKNLKKVITKLE